MEDVPLSNEGRICPSNMYRQNFAEHSQLPRRTVLSIPDLEVLSKLLNTPVIEAAHVDATSATKPSGTAVRKNKTRPHSKQQQRRQRKGVEKAEISRAKLDKKRRDSRAKAKNIKNRRITWDELNEELRKPESKSATNQAHSQAFDSCKEPSKTVGIKNGSSVSSQGDTTAATEESRHLSPPHNYGDETIL